MRRFHFVLGARARGLTEREIAELVERRYRDRRSGIRLPWEDYLPELPDEKKDP